MTFTGRQQATHLIKTLICTGQKFPQMNVQEDKAISQEIDHRATHLYVISFDKISTAVY